MGPHNHDIGYFVSHLSTENSAIIVRTILATEQKSTWMKGSGQWARASPGHET